MRLIANGIISLNDFVRSLRYRRKIYRAGFRIVGTETMGIGDIRMAWVNDWLAEYLEGTDHTIFDMPHYDLLTKEVRGGVSFNGFLDGKAHSFTMTPYYFWQVSLRGIDHPRPHEWICAMGQRLIRLFHCIREDGYRLRCVADRIAVLEDGTLWDGGHRLACLARIGQVAIPTVTVSQWKRRPFVDCIQ